MGLARFYVGIIKIAIALAMIGQLKTCTLQVLGLAAAKSETGMISYSKYTKLLLAR
jgi:hypothetical protein